MLGKMEQRRAEAREKLPRVLDIQKQKLLIAINQTATAPTFSLEDEQSVTFVTNYLLASRSVNQLRSSPWEQSKSRLMIQATLKKHALFRLSKYLECAKIVCQFFLAKRNDSGVSTYIEYVLIHARQFGDPTKLIFKIDGQKAISQVEDIGAEAVKESQLQTASESIVKRARRLIQELNENYDETKFMTLNNQVTSVALIIMRRRIKKNVRIILSYTLTEPSDALVIEAYLNLDDDKTKKNLYDTCIKYMEWYKMQLPYLFFRVLDLYGIEAGELWDLLSSVPSSTHQVAMSLIELSAEYYKYHQSKASLLQHQPWFPYCRYLDRTTFRNLSDNPNANICMILNLLVKMKDKSLVINVNEYTASDEESEWAKVTATSLFKKINK